MNRYSKEGHTGMSWEELKRVGDLGLYRLKAGLEPSPNDDSDAYPEIDSLPEAYARPTCEFLHRLDSEEQLVETLDSCTSMMHHFVGIDAGDDDVVWTVWRDWVAEAKDARQEGRPVPCIELYEDSEHGDLYFYDPQRDIWVGGLHHSLSSFESDASGVMLGLEQNIPGEVGYEYLDADDFPDRSQLTLIATYFADNCIKYARDNAGESLAGRSGRSYLMILGKRYRTAHLSNMRWLDIHEQELKLGLFCLKTGSRREKPETAYRLADCNVIISDIPTEVTLSIALKSYEKRPNNFVGLYDTVDDEPVAWVVWSEDDQPG